MRGVRIGPSCAATIPGMTVPATTASAPAPTKRANQRFVIEGGYPIAGTMRAAANKNAALPIVAACLLATEPVVLHDVPDIVDVMLLIDLLVSAGATAERLGTNSWRIDASSGVDPTHLDAELCERIRGSLLLAGPIVARYGEVWIPVPGGDTIGRRRVDTHVIALQSLGARFTWDEGYRFEAPSGLVGAHMFLDEPSVTGTENAIMAASLASGTTVIENAACEPHVQDLCRFLVAMGAQIDGIGSNILTIHGQAKLGGAEYTIQPDHIEVGSFVGLAAVTGGELIIENAGDLSQLRPVIMGFEKLGVEMQLEGTTLRVPPEQRLQIKDDLGGHITKLEDGPWPNFPADLTSTAVAIATQATGTIMIFEKMFETRLVFTDKLVMMGARIVLCDPHRAVISGPARMSGIRMESPDIRAGMSLLTCALAADGRSVIQNVQQIDRGYERIDERLRALGAQIERLS
ncbi:MAG: UDP-N-acetylglucosamine1-carboxyvinyltransferase [Thermoleophilia bacterium]|nr:UDP-N-acetylglucosamine1-carboxyvinyltransferase [Thermoleophilia bacterium]